MPKTLQVCNNKLGFFSNCEIEASLLQYNQITALSRNEDRVITYHTPQISSRRDHASRDKSGRGSASQGAQRQVEDGQVEQQIRKKLQLWHRHLSQWQFKFVNDEPIFKLKEYEQKIFECLLKKEDEYWRVK